MRSPGFTSLLTATALYATQAGSVRAACSSGRWSGRRWRMRAGTGIVGRIAPSTVAP